MYISLAMTLVSKLPAVMVRTMSNTLSVAMEMVVTTTTSEPRIPGSVTFVKRCQALVPSSCAASICSVGTPLMLAESTTMAKPVWIQIITMMRSAVLMGEVCSHCTGSWPSHTRIWLSRPICALSPDL